MFSFEINGISDPFALVPDVVTKHEHATEFGVSGRTQGNDEEAQRIFVRIRGLNAGCGLSRLPKPTSFLPNTRARH